MAKPTVSRWPMHFAARALDARRLKLAVGDPFPLQDRNVIRGYGAAYGVADAATKPWSELGYVVTVDVASEEMAKRIRETNLKLKDVRALLSKSERASA